MTGRHQDTPTDTLWAEYRANRNAGTRAKLIARYLPLVEIVARGMPGPAHIDGRDRAQDGVFGLAQAIDRYDPDRHPASFETYADYRIQGAIRDAARRFDWAPRSIRQVSRLIDDATDDLRDVAGRWPTDTEVADQLGWTVDQYLRARRTVQATTPIPIADAFDPPTPGSRPVPPPRDTDPLPGEQFEEDDLARYLAAIQARHLNSRTRHILDLYYRQGMNLAAIGEHLGITESRVCQIVQAGCRKLRAKVDGHIR